MTGCIVFGCGSNIRRAKNAEIALSAEKAIRKKKERSLMRLAKELKKRSLEKDSHVTMLGTVRSAVCIQAFVNFYW